MVDFVSKVNIIQATDKSTKGKVILSSPGEKNVGVNVGVGENVYLGKEDNELLFAKLEGGNGVRIFVNEYGSLEFEVAIENFSLEDLSVSSSDNIPEGDDNLYYTNQRVLDVVEPLGYLTTETTTTLTLNGNNLEYLDEEGNTTTIDLELYLDDTNASRITSGYVDENNLAWFVRDDSSEFSLDFSNLVPNLQNAVVDTAFNTATGQLDFIYGDSSVQSYSLAVELDSTDLNTTIEDEAGVGAEGQFLVSNGDGTYTFANVSQAMDLYVNDANFDTDTGVLSIGLSDSSQAAVANFDGRYQLIDDALTTADVQSLIDADSTSHFDPTGLATETYVDDAIAAIVDADEQTLSFDDSTNELTISNGNTVDLSGLTPDLTGLATETYVDNAVAGATGTDLTNYYTKPEVDALIPTDTDDQMLTFVGTTLAISDGNSVDLSSLTPDISGKADVNHTHNAADITDFNTAVDARITEVVDADFIDGLTVEVDGGII